MTRLSFNGDLPRVDEEPGMEFPAPANPAAERGDTAALRGTTGRRGY